MKKKFATNLLHFTFVFEKDASWCSTYREGCERRFLQGFFKLEYPRTLLQEEILQRLSIGVKQSVCHVVLPHKINTIIKLA